MENGSSWVSFGNKKTSQKWSENILFGTFLQITENTRMGLEYAYTFLSLQCVICFIC